MAVWSYLQLEKLRNFQNNCRLFRQKNIDNVSRPPTAAQLLRESAYTTNLIIDENVTTPLPTFIRTGDTYYHKKEHHLNTMVTELGCQHCLLGSSTSNSFLPTNRPYHVTSHFLHRLRSMKKVIWKDERLSEWGTIQNYFQRVEFQNRGAAHTHTCLWSTYSIEQMIRNNVMTDGPVKCSCVPKGSDSDDRESR